MELSHNVWSYLDRREYPLEGESHGDESNISPPRQKIWPHSQQLREGQDFLEWGLWLGPPVPCSDFLVTCSKGLLLTPNPRENLQHLLCVAYREASAEAMETDRAGATRKALTQLQLLCVCVCAGTRVFIGLSILSGLLHPQKLIFAF